MRRTNAGKQLIRKRQVFHALNFIDEYDDAFGDMMEYDFGVKFDESLAIAQYRLVLPPRLQVVADAQLPQQAVSNAVVPAS